MPGPMSTNLEKALAEEGDHPWAFDKPMSQMKGIVPNGTYVAFVRLTLPSGANLGRQGPVEMNTRVHRIVLGRITRGIRQVAAPFFEGFPYEFWYELIADLGLEDTTELADAVPAINEQIPDLGLSAEHLRNLVSNARSAKVGLFYDGLPRLAPYFKQFEEIPLLTGTDVPAATAAAAPAAVLPPVTSANPFGTAAAAFSNAVSTSGLTFGGINAELPRALFSAIAAKRFAILTGLSGSGKTQLARALGQWFGTDAAGTARYAVVPVRSDWTSPEPLLGYEDALRPPTPDGRRAWNVPDALALILRAHADPEHPWALVLDEMNLAHVERYFADVLSGLESGEPVIPDLVQEGGHWYPRHADGGKVPLPTNLVVVGTVNVDETTYQFSPKVLDRAFTFEFRVSTEELAADLPWPAPVPAGDETHLSTLLTVMRDAEWHRQHPHPDQDELLEWLLDLHRSLEIIGLEFGHRSLREALRLGSTLAAAEIDDVDAAWDWIVITKVLPRVQGGRRQLEGFLKHWHEFALGGNDDKPLRPLVARKCGRMLSALQAHQFAAFSE
jgi:MoxR-like ATPase